jgi:hypothetical protein
METYLHKVRNPMIKVLGLRTTRASTSERRKTKNYRESRVYATSALGSATEEGTAASSPEVDGGIGSFTTEADAAGIAEAAKGEIVFSKAGANFFAFSKNTLIRLKRIYNF